MALGAGACGGLVDEGEDDVSGRGMQPWHMWGNVQTIQVTSVGPSSPVIPVQSVQLVQVMYGRPETWAFLCSARLVSVTPAAPVGGIVQLNYLVQLGLGRATQILPNFVQFSWDPSNEVTIQRWTAQALGPPRFNGDTAANVMTQFTAQNIQAKGDVTYVQLPGPFVAQVEVAMHVAPINHVRPEWFNAQPNDHTRYNGGENKGL